MLNILLKTEYGDIYFFEYKNNVMFSYSTNDDYNNIIINMKINLILMRVMEFIISIVKV